MFLEVLYIVLYVCSTWIKVLTMWVIVIVVFACHNLAFKKV